MVWLNFSLPLGCDPTVLGFKSAAFCKRAYVDAHI